MKSRFIVYICILSLVACSNPANSGSVETSSDSLLEHIHSMSPENLRNEYKIIKKEYESAIANLFGIDCQRPSIEMQKEIEDRGEVPMQKCKNEYFSIELSFPSKYSKSLRSEYVSQVVSGPGFFDKGISGEIHFSSIENFTSCATPITGISHSVDSRKLGKDVIWGRVDAFDNSHLEGWDPEPWKNVVCQEKGGSTASIYALCAERNGKTVVICISQAADNPKLAEEIFKTFQWIDE